MTNAELLAKIKAEIERLKDENRKIKCEANERYCSGYDDAFYDLVPFLDTLETEKPMNPGEIDLKKELHDFIMEFGPAATFDKCAARFYDLGCRRTAEKYDEIEYNRQRAEESVQNVLEEAARKSAIAPFNFDIDEEHLYEYPYLPIAEQKFIEGAKWQREQMMKEAVEGTVHMNWISTNGGQLDERLKQLQLVDGQKVRIIIVKE